MDPFTIGTIVALTISGALFMASLVSWLFNDIMTYKQTKAQEKTAVATEKGVEIQQQIADGLNKATNANEKSVEIQQSNLQVQQKILNLQEQKVDKRQPDGSQGKSPSKERQI